MLALALCLAGAPPRPGAQVELQRLEFRLAFFQALKTLEFLRQPMFSLLGLVLAWNLFGEFFAPVFRFSLSLLYPGSSWGN